LALTPGTRLGVYEVTAQIGEGGMGQVFRARDTKLDRDVAIKILPEVFAHDADRLARFQREAKTLASLNHPNIAAIYGLEEGAGVTALVMELVEGEDLSQRIARGAIAIDEALPIAKQIADALEAAHEQGIIHRDLKPANIKVRADGTVKVLDFGLAKAMEVRGAGPGGGAGRENPSMSPTMMSPAQLSSVGVILGTAAYMAPEQARGRAVDRRADIWAFGVVLCEMLTGHSLFTGEDVAEILASVVKESPSLDRLPGETPAAIRRLIARCLVKDPLKRLRDIGEARVLLDTPESDEAVTPLPPSATANARPLLAWMSAGLLATALSALAVVHFRESPPAEPLLRLSITLPENGSVASLALSPDGRRLALALVGLDNGRQLWLRGLDSSTLQLLPNTNGAQYPFWSPDGRYIGFLSGENLSVIPATGGPPQTLCKGPNFGGTWSRRGVILFAAETGNIQRVSATGGTCTAVTSIEPGVSHRFPEFLPDGEHFLYLRISADTAQSGVFVTALDAPAKTRRILADQSSVIFVPRAKGGTIDYLLFLRDLTLMAQPFDATTLQPAGDEFPVAARASFSSTGFARQIAVSASQTGMLAYVGDRTSESHLAWVDRSGRELEPVISRGEQRMIAVSPDEKTVVLGRADALWLRDLTRGVDTRFTFPPLTGVGPVWSPDGTHVAFGEGNALYVKDTGGGRETRVLESTHDVVPSDWSRDGRSLLYTEIDPKTRADLWILSDPLGPSERSRPVKVLATEFNESMGQFSPDGHWIAYVSDESGQDEVWVRPYPFGPGKWKVSPKRASQPRWRRDGRELFFMEGGARYTWTAVPFQVMQGGPPAIGEPKPLFTFNALTFNAVSNLFVYNPAMDGQRFLVNSRATLSNGTLNVMTNWERAATQSSVR
jgi:eukaryotic-like serine/threonine-protein kinase